MIKNNLNSSKHILLFIVCGFIYGELQSQTVNCEIIPDYFNPQQGEGRKEITNVKKNQLMLSFFGGFNNDTISVYQNNKLIKTLVLKSDNDGHTRQSLILQKRKKIDVLKVVNLCNLYCFELPINKNYKILTASLIDSKWKVRYSNHTLFLE